MIGLIALYRERKLRAGRLLLRTALALSVLFPVIASAQVTITTTALPAGEYCATGTAGYNGGATVNCNSYYAKLAASGGSGTYSWQATGLPAGLSLNSSTGVISGALSALTTGAPPNPTPIQVEVQDTTSPTPYTATANLYIAALASGSHSLVINQFFWGGNENSSVQFANDFVEIFNAAPAAIDLQNWTLQISSGGALSLSSTYPIGSLDPYTIAGNTGGPTSNGSYPAYTITYSSSFTASNCNPAQANPNFPAGHCWLNPGQFMLVLLGPTVNTAVNTSAFPAITPDLDLTDGYVYTTQNSKDTGAGVTLNNVGPVVGSSSSSNYYVGCSGCISGPTVHSYYPMLTANEGVIALVRGVGVGPTCSSNNPQPPAAYALAASDVVGYFDQNSGGNDGKPTCWSGANQYGFANNVSSSAKNNDSMIRSQGNGTSTGDSTQTGKQALGPNGVQLSTTAALTPCGDTDNNLTDFAPIVANSSAQPNWALHNSFQTMTPTSIVGTYTPTPCANLSTTGPTVSVNNNQPIVVPQGAGGGNATVTLTVTVTPSTQPVSELFNVSAPVNGISGAAMVGNPISSASIGVPDGNGNLQYTEQFTIPSSVEATFSVPITVVDDAGRYAVNASYSAPYQAQITVGSPCVAPTANAQAVSMNWNNAQPITLSGALGANCNSSDTLVYAIQSGPANGTLGTLSGDSITYTPTVGFAGIDSFTFNVTDTTNPGGALSSTTATVNLVVSATGVPTLSLNCPAYPIFNGFPQPCSASENPFVAGTSGITYNGSTVAPTAAGSYQVVASFAANSGSSQNASANATMAIGPATPTVTVNCPSPYAAYDGSPQACTASVTGIGGAKPAGTLSITYNGSTTAPTNVGTYPVAATFTSSDSNYANASATSTLTIYEPVVTITANNQTMAYGGRLPALTYTISPSVPLQTAPTCVSTAGSSSSVGAYAGAITCSGATKSGCTFNYVAGNMTVQAAPATVTANNQTMNFGAAVPALTYSTSPGDLTFSTAPICSTTATSSSTVGSYPIICSGAANSNYTFSYVAGSMSVVASPATVTANNQTMTYGAAVPALTYSVAPSGLTLSTVPVCSTTATSASAAGNYPIVCSGAVDAGYAFNYVAGNMAVQTAHATVTANNQSMTAGGTVPVLTYTTTPSGLTFNTVPTCSTTATSASPYGSYPITCSGGAVSNYALNYVSGIMAVSFAPIVPNGMPVITGISPQNAAAGSSPVTLTVTGSSFVNGASVLWNGTALTTTFVSATRLTATVPSASLTGIGSAEITVSNPAPGGGTTIAAQTFSIDSPAQSSGAFTVTPASATLTVPHGQSVTTSLAFAGLAANSAVSVVCYNLPALASCNYNATTGSLIISTNANTPQGTFQALVVCTTNQQSAFSGRAGVTALCGLLGFPIGILALYRRRRIWHYGLCVLSVALVAGMIGCGSGGTSTPVPAAQISTALTITIQ